MGSRPQGSPRTGSARISSSHRAERTERRDVFTARIDWGTSVIIDGAEGEPPVIGEPVYTIAGDGQRRGGLHTRPEEWRSGSGTGLRVARSSIPALMRVLADLLEDEPSFGEG